LFTAISALLLLHTAAAAVSTIVKHKMLPSCHPCCSVSQVTVAVHNTETSAGRLVLAAEPIERGDLLAAIPLDMAFSQVTHGGNSSMEVRGF
jgi:hypothetical protein